MAVAAAAEQAKLLCVAACVCVCVRMRKRAEALEISSISLGYLKKLVRFCCYVSPLSRLFLCPPLLLSFFFLQDHYHRGLLIALLQFRFGPPKGKKVIVIVF